MLPSLESLLSTFVDYSNWLTSVSYLYNAGTPLITESRHLHTKRKPTTFNSFSAETPTVSHPSSATDFMGRS